MVLIDCRVIYFFVEWNKNENAEIDIEKHDIQMSEGKTLPVIRINTHEFKPIYECFSVFERKMSVDMLRFYKQQFYDIVRSEKPEKKLYVLPDQEIEKSKDIQFVCGFGTISKYQSAVGYTGLMAVDIFRDIVFDDGNYDSETILTKTIPGLKKSTPYIPVYKYLRAIGIDNYRDFKENYLVANLELLQQGNFCKYKFNEDEKQFDLTKAIERYSEPSCVWKACALIPYLSLQDTELQVLMGFIKDNFDSFLASGETNKYSTYFRKLICFYDWRKYAWK